jgi:hypothetical protein
MTGTGVTTGGGCGIMMVSGGRGTPGFSGSKVCAPTPAPPATTATPRNATAISVRFMFGLLAPYVGPEDKV